MNHTALTLNNVKASVAWVWSLHGPDGETRVIYANQNLTAAAREIARWIPALRDGWVVIEWRNGEPVQTIAAKEPGQP